MYRLIEFVNNYVLLEREAWKEARRQNYHPLVAKTSAAMFESFLWLHLGVEVGAFPSEESYGVARTYYDDYFRSIDVRRFQGRHITSYSLQLQEIRSRFPSLEPLLNVAIQRKDPFSFQRSGLTNNGRLRGPFDVFLMLLTVFIRNNCCQTFGTALNFLPDVEYYRLMKKAFGLRTKRENFPSDLPMRRPKIVLDSDPDNLYRGFVDTIKHMATLQDFFQELLRSQSLENDAPLMLSRFRSSHGWRIDLRRQSVAKRFEQLYNFFDEQISQRISLPDHPDRPSMLSPNFRSVWEFWSPRTFEANA